MAATWLKDAIFYEIYPQSFYDTNGDGVGDLNGITEKLDYIKGLGCNALWINPCYDSPFKDAGYDVRDYKKVAPRYGTNRDLYRLFGEAHNRGMRVILDLVPGHTSEEHPWFRESQKAEKNEYSDRYIWSTFCFEGCGGLNYVAGESQRDGVYVLNFFKCQPALNYGFLHPSEHWQQGMDDPGPRATREAMKDVMRFWLDHGCDGFRVDMADSLVKFDDAQKSGTSAIWRDVRAMLDAEYPEAVLVAEWGHMALALQCGFDAAFCLNDPWTGYPALMRDYDRKHPEKPDNSYFRADGDGDIKRFLEPYLAAYEATKQKGYISLITCNHDTVRPSWNLSDRELRLAYAFLFTMPGVPFLYYGDEIGMRYQELPTHEGGYFRTGSRTPMQWDSTANLGFSAGCADSLYLPVDPSPDAPTVAAQEADPDSLLHFVRELLALRGEQAELRDNANLEIVHAEQGDAFVYRRGGLLIAVNPASHEAPAPVDAAGKQVLYAIGNGRTEENGLVLGPQSFVVFQ